MTGDGIVLKWLWVKCNGETSGRFELQSSGTWGKRVNWSAIDAAIIM